MSEAVTVIDIVAQVSDQTASGAASAIDNVTKLEKAMQRVQAEINKMRKMSKLELTMYAIDKASRGIDAVMRKGKQFAGKVWSATVGIIDKVTAPIRGMISRIGDLIGIAGIASTVLGGLTIKNALDASATQTRYETQFATVAKNVGISPEDQASVLKHASELQKQTMYSSTALTAAAAEFSTYITDVKAIEQMMGTLTDYAAGMSGGIELSESQIVDYATQLGKALNAEDATFDGLKKKGFAISAAQEAILKSSLTSDMEKTAVLTEVISQSWAGLAKQFAKTPLGKIVQVKNEWSSISKIIGDKLYPSVGRLFEMLQTKLPAIEKILTGGAEGLGSLFDKVIPFFGRGIDWAINRVEKLSQQISGITQRADFQEKDLFGKIGILWDEVIAEPFDKWWSGTGQAWVADKMQLVGKGIGSAIKFGISALFGIDTQGAVDNGMGIGQSFAQGFMEGMEGLDWGKVTKGLADVLITALKLVYSNPITGSLATLFLGGKVMSLASGGYKAFNGAKEILSTVGSVSGISKGAAIAKTAQSGGAAAQSALTFAQAGKLGLGAKIGSGGFAGTIAKIGSIGSKALPIIGGLVSLVEAVSDAAKGASNANNTSLGSKIASGIGGFLGGAHGGVMDENATTLGKTKNVAGGALKGAGIGGAIGSVVPGLGTAVGAGVGAAVGAGLAAIGGENISRYLSTAATWWKEFFTETVPDAFSSLLTGVGNFITKDVPYALGYIVGKGQVFFTKTLPEKWDAFWAGVGNFFTETVPAFATAIGSGIKSFFTESIPNFLTSLWEGVSKIVTEVIPAAATAIGSGIKSFFTDAIPNFADNIWNSAKNLFGGAWSAIGSGYAAGVSAHASGGLFAQPHMGLVAEDGAEAIIPLSGKRRQRGLELWEQAGQMLGVKPYSGGGIVPSFPSTASDGTATVTVNMGGINLSVHVNSQGGADENKISQTVRDAVLGLVDDMVDKIASSYEQVCANMPITARI